VSEIEKVLGAVEAAAVASSAVPGPVGIVSQILAATLGAAGALVSAGHDPVEHIQRILAADPLLAAARSDFDARMREKFGSEA
jgi:hypothetical protein